MSVYDINGNLINTSSGAKVIKPSLKDGEYNILGINHRGYSSVAPENTLPAYKLSKTNGFNYVEADVSFTSDGVAVLLHDSTIDRTSDGTGSISSMTYEEVSQYDFGSWKSTDYAGTKIPTFEDFIKLCKNIGLHPYIELKSNGSYTETQIQNLIDIVQECGMKGKVTYISFSSAFLVYVKNYDSTARLGFLASSTNANTINTVKSLMTGENEVFLDISIGVLGDSGIETCIANDIPLEVWTVNSESVIKSLHPYITGVTSDNLVAGKVLYDANIS